MFPPFSKSIWQSLLNQTFNIIEIWIVSILLLLQKSDADKIKYEKKKLQSILSASLDPLLVVDSHGIIKYASDSLETVFGWSKKELIGSNIYMLMPEPYRSKHNDYMKNYRKTGKTKILGKTRVFSARRKNGEVFPCEVSVGKVLTTLTNDDVLFTGIIKDISQRHKMEENIYRLTITDSLTTIYNRRYFDLQLVKEWDRAKRKSFPMSLIMVDIDFFKKYNDLLGHQAGDECIVKVAKAISSIATRTGEFAARYGGEEFVLLLPFANKNDVLEISKNVKKKISLLNISHPSSQVATKVTVSIGASTLHPNDTMLPRDLICMADKALYVAKNDGRNIIKWLGD